VGNQAARQSGRDKPILLVDYHRDTVYGVIFELFDANAVNTYRGNLVCTHIYVAMNILHSPLHRRH
jgi:hypothetical protein